MYPKTESHARFSCIVLVILFILVFSHAAAHGRCSARTRACGLGTSRPSGRPRRSLSLPLAPLRTASAP
eukprot:1161742-Pleurochrysis_carterae.AAC.1